MRRSQQLVVVMVLLALATVAFPVRAQDGDPSHLRNVAYLPTGEGDLLLDVFLPEDDPGPYPVVLMLHGYNGSKGEIDGMVDALNAQGWAVVAPNIRFTSEGFPYDAFCALGWVAAEGDQYGLDRDMIAVYGTALGGQVAALIGSVDTPDQFIADDCTYPAPAIPLVDAVVTWGGFFGTTESLTWSAQRTRWAVLADQNPRDYHALLDEMLATAPVMWRDPGALSEEARTAAQRFPLYWIDGTEPPHLLLYGKSSFESSRTENEIFARLMALGGAVDVTLIDKSPFTEHSGTLAGQTAEIEAFLSEIFAPPPDETG